MIQVRLFKNVEAPDKFLSVYFGFLFVCIIAIFSMAFGDYLKYKERIYQSDKISQCIGTSK